MGGTPATGHVCDPAASSCKQSSPLDCNRRTTELKEHFRADRDPRKAICLPAMTINTSELENIQTTVFPPSQI